MTTQPQERFARMLLALVGEDEMARKLRKLREKRPPNYRASVAEIRRQRKTMKAQAGQE